MKKIIIVTLLFFYSISNAQTVQENFIKTTTYKKELQNAAGYNNFTQSISTNDLLINGAGGASGTISLNNNVFSFNFSGSWGTTNRLKLGDIKTLNTSMPLPDMQLGSIVTLGSNLFTGYFAKVENNKLIFYSPYFVNSVNTTITHSLPGTENINYSTTFGSFYTPLGSGGCSGSISIVNGLVSLNFSGGWSNTSSLLLGNIVHLNTSPIPNTDLGFIRSSNMDTVFRVKIENNYLVFYTNEQMPSLPLTGQLTFSQNIGLTVFDKSESITYYDGLGRSKQEINLNQGGNLENIYTHFEYDNFGRQEKEYMPVSLSNTSGLNFYPNLISQYDTFYNTEKYEYTSNPFVQKKFENSSSSKVMELASAGNDWSMINQKTIKNDFSSNSTNEVRMFEVNFLNNNKEKHQLKLKGFYPVNQLYKFMVKNENWVSSDGLNNTVQEFKDKDGKLILSRRFNRDENGSNEILNTYYVYDDFGNLSYVIPPLASDQIDIQTNSQASASRVSPWTSLVLVDENLAQEYDKFLSQYKNEEYKNQDLLDKFGGYGTFTVNKVSENGIELNIDINTLKPVVLRTGEILSLKEFGEFKDSELGRIKGSGYEYIFYIKNNFLWVSGNGELVSINETFQSGVKLVYDIVVPWASLVDIDPKEAEEYLNIYKEIPNENILTASVQNNYGALGGLKFSIDENDNIMVNLSISALNQLKFKTGIVLPLKMERKLKDVELFSVYEENGYKYNFSIKENGIYIDGEGFFLNAINNLTLNLNPPVDPSIVTQEVLEGLCYQYHYDNRGRLIEKRIPGKGWEYMVYDKLDRPVLSQDANQRVDNKWLFTKYDIFNRVVYSGEFKYLSSSNNIDSALRIELQNLVYTNNATALHESKTGSLFQNGGISINYTDNVFPKSSNSNYQVNINNVNYYDNYSFTPFGSSLSIPTSVNGYTIMSSPKSLSTGVLNRVLGTNNWIISVNAYDNQKYRLVWTKSTNSFFNSEDIVQTKYSFSGNILETQTSHSRAGVSPNINIINKYTYDHADRILKHVQKINSNDEELICFNKYDELGQLIQKKVGGKNVNQNYDNTLALQTIDLKYNIKGWLKTINNPDVNQTDDLFAFKMNYNTPQLGAAPLYNGNISETSWMTRNDNKKRNYKYAYDDLSRLRQADYLSNGLINGQQENYTEGDLRYDKNGNIIKLERFGLKSGQQQIDLIDILSYSYAPLSNKLIVVNDAATNAAGFSNGNNLDNDYEYDINGNLTKDLNKKITKITYNYLNLPIKVVFDNRDPDITSKPKGIRYVYDASGRKLQKEVIDKLFFGGQWWPTQIDKTDYLGYITYQNSQLQFVYQPEGYIKYENNAFTYFYQFKDHLGNVRLTYTDNDNDGTVSNAEIVEENNYYPFGEKHKGYNNIYSPIGNEFAQKYKFGSKELQDELGVNLYDFGARNYDATIGRWMSIDPLANKYFKYSPYTYVGNSPLIAMDPDGARILFVNGHWQRGVAGWIISSSSRGKGYWGEGFEDAAKSYFNDYSSNNHYADGSSYFGGDSSGSHREQKGYEYAKKNYSTLIKDLGVDETFKIVTHSEGGAFGSGIARYLMEMGQKVEYLVHLSPDEGDEFTSPLGTGSTYELSYSGDWITGNKPISDGIDVRAVANVFKNKFDRFTSSHGSTKSASVFNVLKAMRNIENRIVNTPHDSLEGKLSDFYYNGGTYNQNGYEFNFFSINYSWSW